MTRESLNSGRIYHQVGTVNTAGVMLNPVGMVDEELLKVFAKTIQNADAAFDDQKRAKYDELAQPIIDRLRQKAIQEKIQ